MKKNFLFQLLLAAFLLPAFSCSDDDLAPEINNATTLNMLDVENGATRLGNSDIYINAANNFQTNECLIAEIGPSKGIGKVIPPQVGNGLVYQAAVTPGHLYQAFKEEAVKQFPSGKFALALAGDYYQFYVGSEIMKEEKRVGAVIQFALINPEADGLPAYDSTIGTVVSGYEDEIVREFPKDTEFSYDSDLEDLFQITTEGGILRTERRANPLLYMDDAVNGRFASQLSFVLAESLPFEFMLNVLRLYDGVPVTLWEATTGLPYEVIGKKVEALRSEGLLANDQRRLVCTELGRNWLSTVQERFLPDNEI